jgi:hypothetical protein
MVLNFERLGIEATGWALRIKEERAVDLLISFNFFSKKKSRMKRKQQRNTKDDDEGEDDNKKKAKKTTAISARTRGAKQRQENAALRLQEEQVERVQQQEAKHLTQLPDCSVGGFSHAPSLTPLCCRMRLCLASGSRRGSVWIIHLPSQPDRLCTSAIP